MDNFFPICLFTYNRLEHTQKVLTALKENSEALESEIFIFSDGPRHPQDEKPVQELRQFLKTVTGFKKIHLIEKEKNAGLAGSIIAGVTEVLKTSKAVIVLEDDILVSKYFLKFMNEALHLYAKDVRVACVHGYIPPLDVDLNECFFLKGAECWGWATWDRAWKLFNPDGKSLLTDLVTKKLTVAFDLGGTYPYTKMLRDQIQGKNNSWAVRWHASAFLNDKFTIYPPRSLVLNIGFDGTGEHCDTNKAFDVSVTRDPIKMKLQEPKEEAISKSAFQRFYKSLRPKLSDRVRGSLARRSKKVLQFFS